MREAHLAIPRLLAEAREPHIIAISGAVGSGKSHLARQLTSCILATDDYLPDYDTIPEAERDEPRHADIPRLLSDLADLRAGRSASTPVWSFQTHSRVGVRTIAPAPVIVIEGIHALYAPIALHATLAVLVEAPASTRWRRWAWLEEAGQRGWGVEKARVFFDEVAEPTFARYAPAYRARADLIVHNDSGVPGENA